MSVTAFLSPSSLSQSPRVVQHSQLFGFATAVIFLILGIYSPILPCIPNTVSSQRRTPKLHVSKLYKMWIYSWVHVLSFLGPFLVPIPSLWGGVG